MFTTAGDTPSLLGASDGTCWAGSWAAATAGSASRAARNTRCAARPTAAKRRARAFIGVTVFEELPQAQCVRRRAVIVMGSVRKGAPGIPSRVRTGALVAPRGELPVDSRGTGWGRRVHNM